MAKQKVVTEVEVLFLVRPGRRWENTVTLFGSKSFVQGSGQIGGVVTSSTWGWMHLHDVNLKFGTRNPHGAPRPVRQWDSGLGEGFSESQIS